MNSGYHKNLVFTAACIGMCFFGVSMITLGSVLPSSRRCTRCKTEESATAHTIFHNLKFPVNKAFYIAYNVCVLSSDFSTYNYAYLKENKDLSLSLLATSLHNKEQQNNVVPLLLQRENDIILLPAYRDWETDRKSTRLNSSHITRSRMPSSA